MFVWSTSSDPPHVTITGVDDGTADDGLRQTAIGGVVLDCGGAPIGGVYVVDRESLKDPWTIELASGVTTTTFDITLTRAPGSDVTLALSTPDSDVTVSPASVVLGSDNWDAGVTATVTGGCGLDGDLARHRQRQWVAAGLLRLHLRRSVAHCVAASAVLRARAVVAKKPIAIAITPHATAIQQ